MQIVTLYASDTVTILCIYRHYFFSTLIGSFLCIYSDASNFKSYVKEVVYKSLFNDFTPIRTNSDRGDFFFSGPVRQPLLFILRFLPAPVLFQLLPVVHQHFCLLQ